MTSSSPSHSTGCHSTSKPLNPACSRTGQAAAGPAAHNRVAGLRTVAEADIALRRIQDACVDWFLQALQQLNTWSVTQVTVSEAEPAMG